MMKCWLLLQFLTRGNSLLTIFGLLFFAAKVTAYPNFISFGYQSCLSCHYNPFGAGPLTDYGRVVASSAISERLFWPSSTTDEEIGNKAGFFFAPDPIDWLRPSLSYRTLNLTRNLGESGAKRMAVPMDTSASLVGKFLNDDKLTVVVQGGIAGEQERLLSPSGKAYTTRQHYVGLRINKEFGLYAGLMDKVFGLRVPDHIAFSRLKSQNTQYDQTHGVLLHYLGKQVEIGLHPFVGNLSLPPEAQLKGVSSQLEVSLGEKMRVGASYLRGTMPLTAQQMAALHARIGIGEGHSLMLELGQTQRQQQNFNLRQTSPYLFTQSHLHLRRGLFALATIEYQLPDTALKIYSYRLAPGLQFFPVQRLELRADAYRTTQVFEDGSRKNSWDLAAQLHVYL